MTTLLYNNSLEGFLTATFERYDRKLSSCRIRQQEGYEGGMFEQTIVVEADKTKAARVWKGLQDRVSKKGLEYISHASLSELPSATDVMQGFIEHIFSTKNNVEADFSNKYVLEIDRIHKMVSRERHRMKAFIRFQSTKDNIYFASITPDFNVLPLIITHFKNRYADQQWIIYDTRRKYGAYYNLQTVEDIVIDFTSENKKGADIAASFDEKETFFQQLWKDYFKSVNIASRKNMQLHIRHVPRRYWGLLTEKN